MNAFLMANLRYVAWGSACLWCQDEPHACEECVGQITPLYLGCVEALHA